MDDSLYRLYQLATARRRYLNGRIESQKDAIAYVTTPLSSDHVSTTCDANPSRNAWSLPKGVNFTLVPRSYNP